MARVLRRPRAAEDIAEIWDYIAEDNLAAADAFVDRLDRALQRLATYRLLGRARDELAAGLRSFAFERYVTFYEPLVDGIAVVRLCCMAPATSTRISTWVRLPRSDCAPWARSTMAARLRRRHPRQVQTGSAATESSQSGPRSDPPR